MRTLAHESGGGPARNSRTRARGRGRDLNYFAPARRPRPIPIPAVAACRKLVSFLVSLFPQSTRPGTSCSRPRTVSPTT